MHNVLLLLIIVTLSAAMPRFSGKVEQPNPQGNLGFDSRVGRPAYVKQHPKVLFDEAHNNADTSVGRYMPFADLITSDGYSVVPNTASFSASALKGRDILVIVNASGPQAQREAPAFTKEECAAVGEWVASGGALLLITDHAPFSSAMSELFKLFGVELTKGHTVDPQHYDKAAGDQTEIIFTRDEGLVGEHPITRGRDNSERINRITTFTGTSLKGPSTGVQFLKLSDAALDVLPPDRKPAPGEQSDDYKTLSAAGRAQGIAFEFRKGRVVVLSEAAVLTAQITPAGYRFGMNVPGLDNRQLALNIMHWLSGLLK